MEFFSPERISIATQLLLAVLLGGIIGLERKFSHKTAGIKTFALVSLGSALFTMISQMMYWQLGLPAGFDPSRIAAQIVVGVGFLAGGIIIFNDNKVRGLSTSAGVWVSAGIGMAVGFGLYDVAVIGTLITVVVYQVVLILEKHFFDTEE